jgi:uncharacterized protein YndB with AHSA1/START domain
MSIVEAQIEINAPIDEVFALAMDPHTTLEWVTIARHVKDIDGDPTQAGFRMKQQLCLRGVPFWVTWNLVEADGPRFARFEGKGPMRSKAFIENHLEDRDGKTFYRYRNQFKAPFGPLGSTAERIIAGGIPDREAHASLANLKRLAESRVRA